jgi:hypothetical protein
MRTIDGDNESARGRAKRGKGYTCKKVSEKVKDKSHISQTRTTIKKS